MLDRSDSPPLEAYLDAFLDHDTTDRLPAITAQLIDYVRTNFHAPREKDKAGP